MRFFFFQKCQTSVRCQDCGDRRRRARERKVRASEFYKYYCQSLDRIELFAIVLSPEEDSVTAVDVESFTTEDRTIGCNCTINALITFVSSEQNEDRAVLIE